MKKQHILLVSLFTFGAGLALGIAIRPRDTPVESAMRPVTPGQTAKPPEKKARPDNGQMAALRARIADLERQLTARPAANETPPPATATPPPAANAFLPSPEHFRERMARLEKEDPARYAQITNRFASWRRQRTEHAQSRLDFLSSIDTSVMTADARATHEELQAQIAKREELESRLHDPDLSDEDRRTLFREMFEADRVLNDLNRKERETLLSQMATELGFEGEAAQDIAATVHAIVDATENRRPGPPRRRR